ncbi:ABC transporter substrate-binding protein [Sporanaerobium hydrogeniformans]|uniref:ABC transporter substrate-binding protein n=1 Tax=Sporanaerobium hydrogeniformans TaxID=3072179 RepID=UPI0015D51011|nr:extracellular solute-binding protein [Sporanaerobium hydrogeniformans]
MKKFKKFASFLVCMTMLTGCGASSSEPIKETGAPEKQAQTESSNKGEVTTLNVALWDYTSLEYHKKLVAAYEKRNPTVKINVIEAPANDYSDKVAVMLAGNSDIDVVFIRDTASYTGYISKGQLEPLDSYITADTVDLSAYGGMCEQYGVDNQIYGLPYRKDIWMLFYNKDLFDQAGIAYPTDNMTLEQYRETAKKLTSGEGSDKIYGALNNKWTQSVSNLAMFEGTHSLLDGDYTFLKPYYDTVLAMQNEDQSTLEYSTIIASNIHYSGPFYNGQVAMMPMGSWFINNMLENTANGTTAVNWDVAALPSLNGDIGNKGVGAITPVSISSKSKNKDLAWDFVKFVTTEEGAQILAECGIMPAYSSESVLNTLTSIKGFPVHGKDLLLNTTDITIEFPVDEKWTSINKIIGEEHELMMINEVGVDEELATLSQRVKDEVLN